jgi:predicted anti-sigma-YlaC factor YlaD
MTCEEFGRVLPELEGDHHNIEQEEHLKTCSLCSGLVSDLNAISAQARLLAEDQEPSLRVWNSIAIALRQEGLIRDPQVSTRHLSAKLGRWKLAWLKPVTLALVVGAALLLQFERIPRGTPVAQQAATSVPAIGTTDDVSEGSVIDADQVQLLNLVASRAPAMRAGYESDLRAVNAYIRDAETSARNNPNDAIAQQYLMNAYEQRAMVYEMAMNRALP